ncbi:GGDEF domain-containing protein [Anaerocellum diazotrophicum]|uniref:Diguanylate cyclase/phosphodiesterase n=1 Tax=Caldicellulosiruptor diazotrophicus TaxID=2806205 RepID=A0ABM7NQC7_9FIRM|nr:GGDEF domain-containing protein [Caldicellulosiruptor diazotrophicus]BCS82333.1 hypothetical protein CaldiYA01_22930 [Caldicellulosiruptor diazotrophicus]
MFSKFYLSKCFNKGLKTALLFFILNIAYLAGVIYIVFYREPLFEKCKLVVAILTTAVVIADSFYLFYVLYKLLQEKYKLKMFLHKTVAESDILKRKLFEITKKEYKKLPNGKTTKIVEIAYFDMVTGLPNKLQLEIFFDRLRKDVPSHFNEIAVVVLDIENLLEFKTVNLYSLTNVILKDIGYKLKNELPERSFVAKIEDNKFVILFYDYGCRDLLLQYIKIIEEIIDGKWYLVGEELELKSIIGVAFYPNDGNNLFEILRSATKALEHAKIVNHRKIYFTSNEENTKFSFCISLSKELKTAVCKKNFLLVYQPLIDLKKNKVAGAEVFLRWINPQKGIISAKEFMSIAQKEGMIPEIEEWVLDTVSQDIEDFERTCTEEFFISLNVSFLDSYVVERIFSNKVLTSYEKYSDMIVFEISQQDIDANLSECLKVAEEVKQKGFRIIIDDWCSDNIAIDTIRYFPVDAVKIDNRCIETVVFDKSIWTIVKGVIDIAHALKIKVIAEGVETSFHYKIAKDLGCDVAQGFLFSKPLFRSEFLEFYKKHENQLMVV